MEYDTFHEIIWCHVISCSLPIRHLARNPFICDCNLRWLAEYLEVYPVETSGAKCSGPKRMERKRIANLKSIKYKCKGKTLIQYLLLLPGFPSTLFHMPWNKQLVYKQNERYCTSWNFRGGFIFANFASQTLAKISTSIYVYL